MALTKEQTELLTAAVEKCGGQKKLAEYLGYNINYITQLKNGSARLRPVVEAALRGIVNSGDNLPKQKPVYLLSTDKAVQQIDRLVDSAVNIACDSAKAVNGCMRIVITAALGNLVATLILCGLAARMIWG